MDFNERRVAAACKILMQSWHAVSVCGCAMLGRRKGDTNGKATAEKNKQWPVSMKWKCWASTGK